MSSFDKLLEKACELKGKGLTDREIAEELNVQMDTVVWLLLHEKERKGIPIPLDYSVNWSNVGSSTRRLSLIGWALADLAKESLNHAEFEDFDVVVGVELSGCPLGLIVADDLGKPFAAARFPRTEKQASQAVTGIITSSFSQVEGRKVLLVTDVISTGAILRDVIRSLKESDAKPVGMVAFVDKRGGGEIDGVRVKSLVNMIPIKK